MADIEPSDPGSAGSAQAASVPSLLAPLTDPSGGPVLTRISSFTRQPAVKKMLPAFVGLSALGGALLAWSALAPSPQRVLYGQLEDADRAGVVGALDQAGIGYSIDSQTGSLTVNEADFYKARMLVAADGALAGPETGDQMLDKLPMGASRTLEGERMRSAREHDLQLTIMEIDGVDAVRVHLAEGEKSVFVRDNVAPSASVMVRLKPGRQMSESQVSAIVNLVAGSVPGLSPDAVRVVDQHGRLLSEGQGAANDRQDQQSRLETKLREQVSALLNPMLGDANFSSEIQVELDMAEVTSAREAYDKNGVVRSETQAQSQQASPGQAAGVPGVLSNTPPLPATAVPGAPQGTQAPGTAQSAAPAPTNGETSSSRTYELGREVSVANTAPGGVKRLTVAVAINRAALKSAKPQDLKDLEALVSAAVGANPQRGDVVKVLVRDFEPASDESVPFYEMPWFATVVRNGAAVLAVLLVLLLGVRPLIAILRGDRSASAQTRKTKQASTGDDAQGAPAEDFLSATGEVDGGPGAPPRLSHRPPIPGAEGVEVEISRADLLTRQIDLAQRLVSEKPGSAVQVLRQMLNEPPASPEAQADTPGKQTKAA